MFSGYFFMLPTVGVCVRACVQHLDTSLHTAWDDVSKVKSKETGYETKNKHNFFN